MKTSRAGENRIELSIVSPVLNESGSIVEFIDKVTSAIMKLDSNLFYEFILIDDGSTDKTWETMTSRLNEIEGMTNFSFKCLRLAKNYGQSAALLAGMREASGKFILTLDSDLQHPPELIAEFFNRRNNSPVIVAIQNRRQEGLIKKLLSNFFYKFAATISGLKIHKNAGDFRLIRRDILEQILQIDDKNMVTRFAIAKLGVPFQKIDFDAGKRVSGKSNYNLRKMLKFALESVLTLTVKPLRIAIVFSSLFFVFSISQGVYILFLYFNSLTIPGWSSLALICSTGFMAVFLVLGIQGVYIARLFVNNQNFPRYIHLEIFEGKFDDSKNL